MERKWIIPVIDVNKFLLPLVIALLLFSGTLSQTAYAHGLLDQTTTTCPCNSFGSFSSNVIRFQEFVPTQNGIVSIEVEISSLTLSSANPITVNLRNGDATGAIIGSTSTHTGLPAPNTPGTVHFDFVGPIALTPGNLYTIEMTINDGSSQYLWFRNSGNPYPQGDSWLEQPPILFGADGDRDFTLKTYFTDIPIGGPVFDDNFVHAEWIDPSSSLISPTFFDSFSSSGLELFDVSKVSVPAAGQQGIGSCIDTSCQFIVTNFVDILDTKIIQIDVTWGPTGVPVPSVPEVLCDGQQPPAQFVDGNEIDGFASWTFECQPNPDWEGINFDKDPATIIQRVQIWTTSFDDIPIGGTYIPIDQSALLLAGVQSISMWMIPVVVAGVGIGVFVIKRRN